MGLVLLDVLCWKGFATAKTRQQSKHSGEGNFVTLTVEGCSSDACSHDRIFGETYTCACVNVPLVMLTYVRSTTSMF